MTKLAGQRQSRKPEATHCGLPGGMGKLAAGGGSPFIYSVQVYAMRTEMPDATGLP
jgi:hypothetical protein